MCVIEQHTLGILIHDLNIKCNQLLPPGWAVYPVTDDFFHFYGPTMKSDPNFEHLRYNILLPWLDENNSNIAKELIHIAREFKQNKQRRIEEQENNKINS